jgi:hypothetical protein
VQIINHQCDAAVSAGEFREHPVDHRPPIEVGCRRRWFRTAGRPGRSTNRAEQGQPKLLGILLIALHLHEGKPVPLTRTVGPGAQQRRLPAAGRRRDDRHPLRRRAIQSGEKITPVNQPESYPSHRQMPAFVSAPTPSGGIAALAPSSRYQASAPIVNDANHPDEVTAAHMVGGQPGSVAKAPSHGYSKSTLGPRRMTERRHRGRRAARTPVRPWQVASAAEGYPANGVSAACW